MSRLHQGGHGSSFDSFFIFGLIKDLPIILKKHYIPTSNGETLNLAVGRIVDLKRASGGLRLDREEQLLPFVEVRAFTHSRHIVACLHFGTASKLKSLLESWPKGKIKLTANTQNSALLSSTVKSAQ